MKRLKALNSDHASRPCLYGTIDAVWPSRRTPETPSSWPHRPASDRLVSPRVSCHILHDRHRQHSETCHDTRRDANMTSVMLSFVPARCVLILIIENARPHCSETCNILLTRINSSLHNSRFTHRVSFLEQYGIGSDVFRPLFDRLVGVECHFDGRCLTVVSGCFCHVCGVAPSCLVSFP